MEYCETNLQQIQQDFYVRQGSPKHSKPKQCLDLFMFTSSNNARRIKFSPDSGKQRGMPSSTWQTAFGHHALLHSRREHAKAQKRTA
jgi:hypothetical protein